MPHKSIQGSSLKHGNGPPRGIPRGRGNAQVIEPLAGRLVVFLSEEPLSLYLTLVGVGGMDV